MNDSLFLMPSLGLSSFCLFCPNVMLVFVLSYFYYQPIEVWFLMKGRKWVDQAERCGGKELGGTEGNEIIVIRMYM